MRNLSSLRSVSRDRLVRPLSPALVPSVRGVKQRRLVRALSQLGQLTSVSIELT